MRSALCRVSAGEHNQYWERHNCLHLDRSSPAMCSACLVKLNICCSISPLAASVGRVVRGGGTPVITGQNLERHWRIFIFHPGRGGQFIFMELRTWWPLSSLSAFLKHTPTACLWARPFFENKAQTLTSWTRSHDENVWPSSRRRARSRYARGSLHHSQAPVSAMSFIYGPNKPEQNILCGRLQSVLLWLEIKLKKCVWGIAEKHIFHLFLSSRVKYRGASVSF